jgi:hypothetical protein
MLSPFCLEFRLQAVRAKSCHLPRQRELQSLAMTSLRTVASDTLELMPGKKLLGIRAAGYCPADRLL